MSFVDPGQAWQPFKTDNGRDMPSQLVAHLYRRAGFAATPDQIEKLKFQSAEKLVDQLFDVDSKSFEQQMKSMGHTILAGGQARSLAAWWLYRMLNTPDQLLEKTTLFWHGHFATSAAKVNDPKPMLAQNQILRDGALGKFEKLVQKIARDPAMLIYLDSTDNRKTRPNENFARELLELFCLEVGNYTEKDIKQIARCFTGWEVRRKHFKFNKYQHDTGSKSFFGKTGNFDGDQAIKIVLQQKAAPRFIAKKLYKYFVADVTTPDEKLIAPLADQLRKTDFDIGKLVRTILSSQHFYSDQCIGKKIRSPVELVIGFLRTTNASTNFYQLADRMETLGQLPFYPPNVKGWDGGRTWINSSTLLGRANLIRDIVDSGDTKWKYGDLAKWLRHYKVAQPESAVDFLLQNMVAVEIPSTVKLKLVNLASKQNLSRHTDVADLVHAISLLPEFQLA